MRLGILLLGLSALVALGSFAGCDDVDPLEPRPELAPLVGTWRAERVLVMFDEPGLAPFELVGSDGSFFLTVQPSGLFTASATFRVSTVTRLGRLRLEGDTLVFENELPAPATGRLGIQRSAERVLLTGRPFLIRGIPKKLPVEGRMEMELVRLDP